MTSKTLLFIIDKFFLMQGFLVDNGMSFGEGLLLGLQPRTGLRSRSQYPLDRGDWGQWWYVEYCDIATTNNMTMQHPTTNLLLIINLLIIRN